jgi:hypothetical protein
VVGNWWRACTVGRQPGPPADGAAAR